MGREADVKFRQAARVLLRDFPDYFARTKVSRGFSKEVKSVARTIKNFGTLKRNIDYTRTDVYFRFDKSFFFLNLYKNLISAENYTGFFERTSFRNVIDCGSGSGAASLALSLLFPKICRNWILVDHGLFQLERAKEFRAALGLPEAQYIEGDFLTKKLPPGFVLASYAFYEHLDNPETAMKLKRLLANGALIVDFSSTLRKVDALFAYSLPEKGMGRLGLTSNNISATTSRRKTPIDLIGLVNNPIVRSNSLFVEPAQ